jgi:hypothetical protein
MFQLRTEKYYVDYGNGQGAWTEKQVLVRDDGVKLMNIGGGREMQDQFIYSDKDLSFKILATRYDAEGRKLTDTWNVDLGVALRSLERPAPQSPQITLSKVREIAQNVEEALRAWPPYGTEKGVPIRQVRFRMTGWPAWNPAWGDTL